MSCSKIPPIGILGLLLFKTLKSEEFEQKETEELERFFSALQL